jgi:NDP-sugar pyrophosphorylase family protein
VADQRRSAVTGEEMLHPVGIYVFDRSVLDAVPATSFQDIKEALIPSLYRSGQRVEVFSVRQPSPRVMDASTYLAANHWMIQRLGAQGVSAKQSRGDGVVGSPRAWVDPKAVIVGPVMLGAGVRVMAGATIVGPASIGDGTTVEAGAVVARSVVWNDCVVGERALVDNSILADESVIPAEETVTNAIRVAQPQQVSRRRLLPRRQPALQPARMIKPAWS